MPDRIAEDYARELDGCEPMTAEEEYALAVQMRTAPTSKAREAARSEFARRNLRRVVALATALGATFPLPMPERIAAGNVGLMLAVDKFEPERGYRFGTMAHWWIRHAIHREQDERGRLVRTPTRRQKDVEHVVVSMDAETDRGGGVTTLHDVIPDPSPGAEEGIVEDDQRRQVRALLDHLPPRERQVIELRFGFDRGGEERTLREVGEVLGVCRERARQIEAVALGRIRRVLSA